MAHPGGRPTKYKPEYCKDIIDFFSRPLYRTKTTERYVDGKKEIITQEVPNFTPFLIDWIAKHDLCVQTPHNWCKEHPEFLEAYNRAKTAQEKFLVHHGLTGDHNAFMTFNTLKNVSGWREEKHLKQEVDITIEEKKADLNERLHHIGAN